MPQIHSTTAADIVAQLAEPPRLTGRHPIAARFVYSLRLIALHERARRDPVPELAQRLGSVEVAARSLVLAQTISAIWPENIHVSRFCCGFMGHDEATLAAMIEGAVDCDRAKFEDAAQGLIRPDRTDRLWDSVLGLVAAEARGL